MSISRINLYPVITRLEFRDYSVSIVVTQAPREAICRFQPDNAFAPGRRRPGWQLVNGGFENPSAPGFALQLILESWTATSARYAPDESHNPIESGLPRRRHRPKTISVRTRLRTVP